MTRSLSTTRDTEAAQTLRGTKSDVSAEDNQRSHIPISPTFFPLMSGAASPLDAKLDRELAANVIDLDLKSVASAQCISVSGGEGLL